MELHISVLHQSGVMYQNEDVPFIISKATV